MENRVRRTVSVSAEIAGLVDREVGMGTAESVSALVEAALVSYIRDVERGRLRDAVAGLPEGADAALITDLHTRSGRALPWGVLNAR